MLYGSLAGGEFGGEWITCIHMTQSSGSLPGIVTTLLATAKLKLPW